MPITDATTLASASPMRGPAVTTRMWIDDTRPRSASGVRICTIELRSTALMTSAPADSARNSSASGKLNVDSPNPTIAEAPHRDRDQHGATRPAHGRRPPAEHRAEHRPEADAPTMKPTPAGPTPNTSSASAGNSDLGHPKTIALMSTTKVASTSRRLRANRSPSATAATLGRTAPGVGGIGDDQQQGHDHGRERHDVDQRTRRRRPRREDDPADRGSDDPAPLNTSWLSPIAAGSRSLGTRRGIADARAGCRSPRAPSHERHGKMAISDGAGVSAITASARLQAAEPELRERATAAGDRPRRRPRHRRARRSGSGPAERATGRRRLGGRR